MNEDKQKLKGSPSRDMFKFLHKNRLSKRFYGCDLDFIIVEKYPYRIAAFLDFKKQKDSIAFSEVVAYNTLMNIAPVFIVKGNSVEIGRFWIYQYRGGDPNPDPPTYDILPVKQCGSWVDFEQWEYELRNNGVKCPD